jgi:lipopolysaccharide/colanic/teichoic acid biosynthesis glycosyltransferase
MTVILLKMKRIFNLCFGVLGLILISPLIIMIAFAIKAQTLSTTFFFNTKQVFYRCISINYRYF